MSTRPALVRSIPFWALLVASLASAAAGALILVDKLGVMTTTLIDGTATGIEVYVGQSMAVLGAVLIGAGVLGVLLTLTVATVATLRPHVAAAPLETVPVEATVRDEAATAAEHGYEHGLGYTGVIDLAEPVSEPAGEPVGAR